MGGRKEEGNKRRGGQRVGRRKKGERRRSGRREDKEERTGRVKNTMSGNTKCYKQGRKINREWQLV